VLRREVRREAATKLREIEASGDVLPGPDVWMILLGTALRLFSQHHGRVLDADGSPLDLEEGIHRLGVVVREVRGEVAPLPAALQEADGLTQVWFMHVAGKPGWTRDGLHIELRAYAHSVEDLEGAGLVRAHPDDRGRLVPVPVLERWAEQRARFDGDRRMALVDKLHQLIGTFEGGDDVLALLHGWRGYWNALGEALKALARADAGIRDACERVLRVLDGMEDESLPAPGSQVLLDLGRGSS
jgi:hypothetical protein